MTAFDLIQGIVITLIVGASANQAARIFAPGSHKRARHWLLARLGMKDADPATVTSGCDSGCGSCSGCGSTPTRAKATAPQDERPLSFHPRKN